MALSLPKVGLRDRSLGDLFNAGFRPCRRGPFVSAKGPKTISARARPYGRLCHVTKLNGSETRSAQTVLARIVEFGAASKPHPKASEILKKPEAEGGRLTQYSCLIKILTALSDNSQCLQGFPAKISDPM